MTEQEIRELENPGFSPSEWEIFIEDTVREHASLDRRECPKCGGALSRSLDPRQAGPTSLGPGTLWFNYTCGSCPWFGDRKERE